MIPESDGKKLLKLARDSVESYFSNKEIKVDDELKKKYSEERGVFVTLQKQGDLRGCIGFPEPIMQLIDAIIDAAKAAAFQDPRFPQVSEGELKDIDFEISVLTVPEEIVSDSPEGYLKQIKIGEDGLIIRGDMGSGLLLPQVFIEYPCDAKGALEMTCQKAGLNKDAWKKGSNKIFKFQAQIFSESKDHN